MNIVYACDDKYAELAGVSMLSLFENNKNAEGLRVFLIDNGISAKSKEKLLRLAEIYARKLSFINVLDIEQSVGIRIDCGSLSLATWARLFLASLLPEDVERLIYIDCDTMVRSSLQALWEEDLCGNVIGGVYDVVSAQHKKSIGLRYSDIYINAGVLLMDLHMWKRLDSERRIALYIKLFDGKLLYVDQDAINAVCRGSIKPLNPKYNNFWTENIHGDTSRQQRLIQKTRIRPFYNTELLTEAKHSPVIAHFYGSNRTRPWVCGSKREFKDEYLQYRSMSPWADQPLWECPQRSGLRKAAANIADHMPRRLYFICCDVYGSIMKLRGSNYGRKRLKTSEMRLEDCFINPADLQ